MEIRWTRPALDGLRSICDFIAKDSRYYADKVIEGAFDKVDRLVDWPDMGHQVPEENDPTIRELMHYSYRIVY